MSPEYRAALLLGRDTLQTKLKAVAEYAAEENTSLLDHYRIARAGIYTLLDAALDGRDRVGYSMLVGRLHENLAATARLTGQLSSNPMISHMTINNNLHASPEYARLRDGLLQLAREHPEIRPALFAMLKRLDTEPTPQSPPRGTLLIEQESAHG
jgi:hypothetical protein